MVLANSREIQGSGERASVQCAVQCADGDPLLRIIEAWPVLPETVRQAIRHLVSASLAQPVAGQQPPAPRPAGRARR